MQSLSFCKAFDPQQKEQSLSRIIDVLLPPDTTTEDDSKTSHQNDPDALNEQRLSRLTQYLKLCRSSTIKNDKSLAPLLRENHTNPDDIKLGDSASCAVDATFWIADMIDSDCLLMFISSKRTFLVDLHLNVHQIVLQNDNNFAKICVDCSNESDCTVLQGSFMAKSAQRKEFLIEDVLCYKSQLLTSRTLHDRLQLIATTVGNYRQIKGNGQYPFDFRGKPWIRNNSPAGCRKFFEWYRVSGSTGKVMFADKRHPENFSRGFMVWSNGHSPISEDGGGGMLNFVYPPQFYVQIRLPIQARHNNNRYGRDGQQHGMYNKHGQIQDFNASTNQQIQMFLRNDLDGTRTVMAIKAQFDEQSVQRLVQISSTNTHSGGWLVAKITYNKEASCYSLINTLSESKITTIVESNYRKYNQMLLDCGSTSTVHSASPREQCTLLTASVTDFVANCTRLIQTCTKEKLVEAFQSVAAPAMKQKNGHSAHSQPQQRRDHHQSQRRDRHHGQHHQTQQHHHPQQQQPRGHHGDEGGYPQRHHNPPPPPSESNYYQQQRVPEPPNYHSGHSGGY